MSAAPRPVIGINADFFNDGKQSAAHSRIAAGFYDAVLTAGGLPVVLPPVNKQADIDALLDMCDGVILTGGLDMDPKRLGMPPHAAVRPMALRREESDRTLARTVVDRQMPVLAVGLGMQQINAALGGSLFLHLPEDCPKALPHFDPAGGAHLHMAFIEPNTKLEEIYGNPELRVNSHHHQAIDTVGRGLRVSCRAPDGVVEAVESVSPEWFCLGVQWHPEMPTASALDMQLFECFVQEAARAAEPAPAAAAA